MSEGEEAPAPTFDWIPAGGESLADGEYDAIVLGTGLTECIISGLLSVRGLKVLHMDRNNYYGAEAASLNLNDLFQKFRGVQPPAVLGRANDYNVDLIPKFIMACGNLVKILLHTKVTRYLNFKVIDGSYVYKSGRILKVPATPTEALNSSLMGMFEKRRFRKFLIYMSEYEENNPATHEGRDLNRISMRRLFEEFGLDDNTASFVGHAMALRTDDTFMDRPAIETVRELQLYCYSLERYGKSPYIYPVYGLGGLPEGFSRLCAIHGGVYMLNTPVDELLTDSTGQVWGVRSGNQYARASMVIGDPSYFPSHKVRRVGQVVRSICVLDHPIANTENAESTQVVIPAAQVNRNHDIYVCMVSSAHEVAPRGKFVAIVSTTVETANPLNELRPGIELLGSIVERFDSVSDLYEPTDDGRSDRCFISKSYDATSHFETTSDDVLSLYRRILGEELDMNISADTTETDD